MTGTIDAIEPRTLNGVGVQKRLGISESTFYRLLKNPTFPRGRSLGARPNSPRLWDVAEVDQWWQSLPRS